MRKVSKMLLVLLLVLTTGVLFAAAQKEQVAADATELTPGTYTWTAGGMGGGWYVQAGGMSSIITSQFPQIALKVIPGGGTENPLRLDAGEDDFGWGVGYVDKAAQIGLEALFNREVKGFAGVAGPFSVDFYHFFAAKSTGITTIDELVAKVKAGERINLAGPMVGTSEGALTELLFQHYGISYAAIEKNGGRVQYAAYGDMVNLYKDRHVDYVIACLGLPGAAITEMAISRDSTLLAASDDLVKFSANTYGTVPFESGLNVIPGGTYKGIDKDIQAIGHSTEIIVRSSMSEVVVYSFVKALIENIDAVKKLNPSFEIYFNKETAAGTMVPLHPGAAKYFKEIGVL